MKIEVELPKKVKQRLEYIQAQFNEIYYKDKLDICNLIYNKEKTDEDIFKELNRYAAYRIYYYEPELLDEDVLGEDIMYQIRLLYDLAIETV